MDLAGR